MTGTKIPYWVIAILFLYIVYLQECQPVIEPTPVVTTDTLLVTDTLYSKLPPDTIRVSVSVIEYDTVYVDGVEVKEYTTYHTDFNLSASWKTGVEGLLLYQDFEYSLINTPTIVTTRTITTNRYITKEVNKQYSMLSAGLELYGNELMFDAAPVVSYKTKKDNTYYVKYGLLSETIHIGFTTPLFRY